MGVGGVLFLVTLGGCFVDDEIHLNATALDITVDEARKSFETSVSTFYLSPPTATRAVDMELLVTPLWEKAKSLLFEEKKIVEIPLEAPITAVHRIWTHKDSIPANNKYTNTVTSLIAEKSEAGRIFFTVVKISGEGNYLMRNNKRFLKMRFETLSDFSGAVRYYTLNGELISGKIYKQGKAVKSIAPYDSTKVKKEKEIQQGKARIYTRATVEQCEVHDYLIEQYYCTDTYVGDELMNTYCELADSWIETVMVCDYIEVPDETPNEVCPNCGQNPCGCENPGEGGGGNTGEPIVWSGDVQLDLLKREMLNLGLRVENVLFKRDGGLNCRAYAQANRDGSISFCTQFKNLPEKDQLSAAGHECYHHEKKHHEVDYNNSRKILDSPVILPTAPESVDNYIREKIEEEVRELYSNFPEELIQFYIKDQYAKEYMITAILPPEYSKNEIETYTWEINSFPDVTSKYAQMREYFLWYYQNTYEISKNNY